MTRACGVLLVAACNATPVSEHVAPIIGGTVSSEDAVVALSHRARPCGERRQVACTAALVAPRALLTAAHCVADASPASLVVITGGQVDDGERVEIDAIEVHPDYDGVGADLAVIALAEPLPYTPVLLRRAPIDTSVIGQSVRVIGYGVADDAMTGVKREGTARITEVEAGALVLAPEPALPCHGDSGGPVLLAGEVVGVVAFGDPTCAVSNTSTRVDIHVDTFVEPALARIAAGAPISRSSARTCTACERAEDCPRGAECVDGTCAILGSEQNGLGETCTSDQTCAGSPCLAGLDDTACHCLVRCDDEGCGCSTRAPSDVSLIIGGLLLALRRRRVSRRGAARPGRVSVINQRVRVRRSRHRAGQESWHRCSHPDRSSARR